MFACYLYMSVASVECFNWGWRRNQCSLCIRWNAEKQNLAIYVFVMNSRGKIVGNVNVSNSRDKVNGKITATCYLLSKCQCLALQCFVDKVFVLFNVTCPSTKARQVYPVVIFAIVWVQNLLTMVIVLVFETIKKAWSLSKSIAIQIMSKGSWNQF